MAMRDVQHQPRAHRKIQRALANQRLPHALLFAGPEGVGKEMMALGLAQMLLCSQPIDASRVDEGESGRGGAESTLSPSHPVAQSPTLNIDACNECDDCCLVLAGTHPDLQIIYRQLNRQHPDSVVRKQKALVLGVDVIRHFLIDRAGTYPSRGRAKIFIIREAERMNDAAQNSLLKTLEEPPRSTYVILLTSALDRMLPTTRSRCQQVAFAALPVPFVREQLERLRPDASPEALRYAAARSGGSLGSAQRLVDDGVFALKQPWGQRLVELVRGGRGFAPHALAKPFDADAKSLAKLFAEWDPDISDTDATRAGLAVLLGALTDFYADALRQAVGASLEPINADQLDVVQALARENPASLAGALRSLNEADANLARNANIELTLENLFISLARAKEDSILV